MITASQPYVARYRYEHKGPDGMTKTVMQSRPVVAWSDEGAPLVEGEKSLQPAADWHNFAYIEQDDDAVVTALPGGGWRVAWPQDDESEFVEPVLAWLIHPDGTATAISADADGVVDRVPTDSKVRFISPDTP